MYRRLTLMVTTLGCGLLLGGTGSAATFNVDSPVAFQAALDEAASNSQTDVINVLPCNGGVGCIGTVYDITGPLVYFAAPTEGFGLTIDGADSDRAILDGGGMFSILRIDTTQASAFAELIIRGLTLRNGRTEVDRNDGGALWIDAGPERIEVSGSVFDNNQADRDGGALWIRVNGLGEAPILIRDVTFSNNRAFGNLGNGDGGAAYVLAPFFVGVDVVDVDFIDNSAAGAGGGLFVGGTDPMQPTAGFVQIFDVLFEGNNALAGNGGGASVTAGSIDIRRAGFVSNFGSDGGGLYVDDYRDFTMVNSGFARNGGDDGGGLATGLSLDAQITITNNTFFRNSGDMRGGGMLVTIGGSTGIARIYNNIVYDNFVTGGGLGADVYVENDPIADIPSSVEFFNNAITDLMGFPDATESFGITSSAELTAGGNIDDEPLLPGLINDIDPSQAQGSPTIDAGLASAPAVPGDDFEGDPRPVDGDFDNIAVVDIGMDEFVPGAVPQADLAVTQSAAPDPVQSGQNLTYTVTVSNNGPDPATGVTLTERLDPSLTLVSASFGAAMTACTQPDDVVCSIGSLADGESVVATIVAATPDVMAVTNVFSSATVVGSEADPESANDFADSATQVLPAGPPMADLAVSITDLPDPAFVLGADVVYSVTVDNAGPSTATAVTLDTTLPVGLTFVAVTTASGTCDPGPDGLGVLTCNLDDLPSGNNATVRITASADPLAMPAAVTVTASVSAAEEDPDLTDNTAAEETTINPASADLTVTGAPPADDPSIGENFTVTLTVTNAGPSLGQEASVTVDLPALATLVSADPACEEGEGFLFCALGDLAVGASRTLSFTFTAPDVGALLELAATLGAEVSDPDPADNSVTVTIEVIDVIPIIIEGEGGTGALGLRDVAGLLGLLLAMVLLNGRGNVTTASVGGAGDGEHATRARDRGPGRGGRPGGRTALLVAALAAGALLGLGTTTSPAYAQAERGFYVGANVGAATAGYDESDLTRDLAGQGWTITQPSVDDSDLAWKAYGGFAFNRFFAFEAGWVDLGVVDTRFGASVPPNQVNAILQDTAAVHPTLGNGFTVAGVARWPFAEDRLAVFGRVGLFVWNADIDVEVVSGATGAVSSDENGTDFMYGIGLEWRFTDHLSATGEWERYRLNDWVDVPTVGIRYRFGN